MIDQGRGYPDDDPVVQQYQRWVYPEPVADLGDPSIAKYLSSFKTLGSLTPFYWPAGLPREDLDILVAGCGTMAAACFAHLYPRCRVVGIDISRASLEHQERLREHHKLANLTLRHCPLEEAAGLGIGFHYISCHGVLHHLAEPAAGMRALGGALHAEGVMSVMVYARYARHPVYMMQDLFRIAGLNQTPEDVAVARQALAAIPPGHPLYAYLSRATDLGSDAGLVDTFLHRRDRSYRVSDCLELVGDAGLVFQGWDRNYFYHPEGLLADAVELRKRLEGLPDEQLWQAMELAFGQMAMHWFYVCRADRDPRTYRIPWNSQDLLDRVPLRAAQAQLMQRQSPDGRRVWAVGHAQMPPVVLTDRQAAIFTQIDGRRTARQCLAAAGINGEPDALLEIARDALRLFWRIGISVMVIQPRTDT
jgi:SAM-dependent methyltransferase